MPAVIFWGDRPEEPYEKEAACSIYEKLKTREEQYFIFVNFHIPNAQIDLAILKNDCICIIELKNCYNRPVQGTENSPWVAEGYGVIGDKNPVHQIIHQYHKFRDWLEDNKYKFLPKQKASVTNFVDIKKIIAIWPNKNPRSEINVKDTRLNPPLGNVLGFDEVPDYVQRIYSKNFRLKSGEIEKMADVLNLSPKSFTEIPKPTRKPLKEVRLPQRKWIKRISIAFLILVATLMLLYTTNGKYLNRWVLASDVKRNHVGKEIKVRFTSKEPRIYSIKNDRSKHFIYLNDKDSRFAVQIEELIDSVENRKRYYDHRYSNKKIDVKGKIKWPRTSRGPRIELKDGTASSYLKVCE